MRDEFPDHINVGERMWQYIPQDDITVLELAYIVEFFIIVTGVVMATHAFMADPSTYKHWDKIGRHFRAQKSD